MIYESDSRRVIDSATQVTVTIEICANMKDRTRILRMLSDNRIVDVINKGLDSVYKEGKE